MIRLKIFGIKIEISFLYLSLIAVLSIYDRTGIVIWGIFSSFFHEICHLITLYIFRIKPTHMIYGLSGIKIVKENICSPVKEIIVLISGCLGNLLLFLICIRFGLLTGATINLCLFVFNLLPSMVLDGGQILYTIFECFFGCYKSFVICKVISIVVSFILLITGVVMLLYFKNPTMMFTGAMLMCSSVYQKF